MKVLDIPKSGKCGNRVWQRNRFCQYSYPAFVPVNPRTPAQVSVRANFRAVSARWRELTQEQRDVWDALAKTMKSKPRLGQCGPLTGFLLFMKVNVRLVNRGLPQVDLPLEYPRAAQPGVLSALRIGQFDQPPVGPVLFLRANQVVDDWQEHPQDFMAGQPP